MDEKTALFKQYYSFITMFIGIVNILAGFLILSRWYFHHVSLTNPNSSFCFILIGIAILLATQSDKHPLLKLFIVIIASLLLIISFLTLYEYFFTRNLGIYAIFTAQLFFLTGISFLLIIKENANPWAYQTILWLIFSLALFSLCNYINGTVDDSHYLTELTTMSFYTTLLFLLSSMGMLLLRPDKGIIGIIFGRTTGGKILRLILPFIIIVPVSVMYFENQGAIKNFYTDRYGNSINMVAGFAILSIIIAIIANVINHEEKKLLQAKDELLENQNIFCEFAERFDAVLYRASIKTGKIFYVSPTYEKIWGKPVSELYKNPRQFYETVIPEDKKQVAEMFFNKIQFFHAVEVNYRIRRPDGEIRHIYAKAYQLKDSVGKPKYIIGIAFDITESLKNKKLKELEKDIDTLLSNENSVNTAGPEVLKLINKLNIWDFYELWLVDEKCNVLRCVSSWFEETQKLLYFHRQSASHTFKIGEGLPGMAWKSGTIMTINDYAASHKFHRSKVAEKIGLQSSLAIPIISRAKVLGVLNFFSIKTVKLDEELQSLLQKISKSLGNFIYQRYTEEQINRISRFDLLTGLLNRSAIEDDIDNIIHEKEPCIAVIIMDISNFRLINEAQGHDKGDQLLIMISERLEKFNEKNIARLVADKFVIYFRKYKFNEEIEEFTQKFNNILKEPFILDSQEIMLSVKMGIAIYPKDGKDAKTLINNADIALSISKQTNEQDIQFFNQSMNTSVSEKLKLGIELQHAIKENQLIMYYQPQINLKSGKIVGAEALVRWQHPEKGIMLPQFFLPYAEESGLINSLNEYIIRMVFKTIGKNWQGPPVAINISPDQFKYKCHLLDYLEELLNEYQVDSTNIMFEIAENTLMHNVQHNLNIISALKQMGFKLALDDFGTGFSSFSYLQHFVVDKIKIDRSFINGLPIYSKNALIVQAIINLFHSLKIEVVAEGVETIEEANFLNELKCDTAQGFYYYKPMPLEKFLEVMNSNLKKT